MAGSSPLLKRTEIQNEYTLAPRQRLILGLFSRPTPARSITLTLWKEASYLLGRLMTGPRPVAAFNPQQVHVTHSYTQVFMDPSSALKDPFLVRFHRQAVTLNATGRLMRSHPFTSKRFHVLLNSLFKVLFNFPSRYLSSIGLVSVFSLRWSLPPTLGCILKQPDSKDVLSRRDECP